MLFDGGPRLAQGELRPDSAEFIVAGEWAGVRRGGLHLAEVIRMAQEEGTGVRGVDIAGQPEAELHARRAATRRRARMEALVALGAMGLAAAAIARAAKKDEPVIPERQSLEFGD